MDIGSGKKYPANALSNFAPHKFMIDGVTCHSMEGFLQSLKFKNTLMQREVCKLVGRAAKFKGKPKKWWRTQTLYWQGQEIDRHSPEYQQLIKRAYDAMWQHSSSFRRALIASRGSTLTHSIGKRDAKRTILTNNEFMGHLNRLRNEKN